MAPCTIFKDVFSHTVHRFSKDVPCFSLYLPIMFFHCFFSPIGSVYPYVHPIFSICFPYFPIFSHGQVGLTAEDRFAQVASMSWDVHVIEVYGTMAARATSVTCEDLVKKSGPDAWWLGEFGWGVQLVQPAPVFKIQPQKVEDSWLPPKKVEDSRRKWWFLCWTFKRKMMLGCVSMAIFIEKMMRNYGIEGRMGYPLVN